MKILIAPDSFKGSMTSVDIIKIIERALKTEIKSLEVVGIPIADGGEGTIEACLYGSNGKIVNHVVKGPLGQPVEASYGQFGDTAIIEMANCSGITLSKSLNPLEASSCGTGEMINKALDDGFRKFIIGIGGSATNDGGIGAMTALGIKFLDNNQKCFSDISGSDLINIKNIDLSGLDYRIKKSTFKVMCDVNNPLTGSNGATFVYGPQKGANKDMLQILENGMISYEKLLKKTFDEDIGKIPGSGAAGGIGAAFVAFLNAELVSGIHTIFELVDFENQVKTVDLVITGEGRVDGQSVKGKVIDGIALYASKYDKPMIVITGGVSEGYEQVYSLGVTSIFTLQNRPMSLETSMENSEVLLASLIKDIARLIMVTKKGINNC